MPANYREMTTLGKQRFSVCKGTPNYHAIRCPSAPIWTFSCPGWTLLYSPEKLQYVPEHTWSFFCTGLSLCFVSHFLLTRSCTNATFPNLSTRHYAGQILAMIMCIINCNTTESYTLITVWWQAGVWHRRKAFLLQHRQIHSHVLAPFSPDTFGILFSIIFLTLLYFQPVLKHNLTWNLPPLPLFSPNSTSSFY